MNSIQRAKYSEWAGNLVKWAEKAHLPFISYRLDKARNISNVPLYLRHNIALISAGKKRMDEGLDPDVNFEGAFIRICELKKAIENYEPVEQINR